MNARPKAIGAASGAVGLSGLALALGACCVSPWAVTLLGVAGAVSLARLAFVQPYLVVATVVLAGLGFWYAYRRTPERGAESCDRQNRNGLRGVVWIGAGVALAVDLASFAPRFLS